MGKNIWKREWILLFHCPTGDKFQIMQIILWKFCRVNSIPKLEQKAKAEQQQLKSFEFDDEFCFPVS